MSAMTAPVTGPALRGPAPAAPAPTPRPLSPTAMLASPATRPPSTPEATPRPSPNGRARSKPSAPQPSPRDATQTRHQPGSRLTEDDIGALITALGNLRDVIGDAGAAEKAAIYD
jgi:hypothetical protein